jgi:hypothetical protein
MNQTEAMDHFLPTEILSYTQVLVIFMSSLRKIR